ncbi:MAG: hypothetical protein ACREA3_07660 [Nitrosotalea sp.]
MSETLGTDTHKGQRRPNLIPIGIAILMIVPLIDCFVINAQAGGYAGGNGYPWSTLEDLAVMEAGVLVAYFVFIWRSATRGYAYKNWAQGSSSGPSF